MMGDDVRMEVGPDLQMQEEHHMCDYCGKEDYSPDFQRLLCPKGCNTVIYCSAECQEESLPRHACLGKDSSKYTGKIPVSEYDNLLRLAREDCAKELKKKKASRQKRERRKRNKKRLEGGGAAAAKPEEVVVEEEEEAVVDECAICFEELHEAAGCGQHNFHLICIDKWVVRCKAMDLAPVCPMCRGAIEATTRHDKAAIKVKSLVAEGMDMNRALATVVVA